MSDDRSPLAYWTVDTLAPGVLEITLREGTFLVRREGGAALYVADAPEPDPRSGLDSRARR